MSYQITAENAPKVSELMELFSQTSWAKTRSSAGIKSLLEKTELYIAIRDEGKLIGYGRALTDGVYRALIDDIVVDQKYRKKGLGGQIVSGLMEKLEGVEEIFLNTGNHLKGFYQKYGFEQAECLTMKL